MCTVINKIQLKGLFLFYRKNDTRAAEYAKAPSFLSPWLPTQDTDYHRDVSSRFGRTRQFAVIKAIVLQFRSLVTDIALEIISAPIALFHRPPHDKPLGHSHIRYRGHGGQGRL
jgi:hypothetical protein